LSGQAVLALTEEDFDEYLKNTRQPILVDFWASWCGPCKMIAPSLEELAAELEGSASIVKVNVEDNGNLANRFGISSIPTLILFKNGRVVDQLIGAAPKQQIRRMLEQHLS